MKPDGVSDEARVRTSATLAERGIELIGHAISTKDRISNPDRHEMLE
jgi:hypothetical protein